MQLKKKDRSETLVLKTNIKSNTDISNMTDTNRAVNPRTNTYLHVKRREVTHCSITYNGVKYPYLSRSFFDTALNKHNNYSL